MVVCAARGAVIVYYLFVYLFTPIPPSFLHNAPTPTTTTTNCHHHEPPHSPVPLTTHVSLPSLHFSMNNQSGTKACVVVVGVGGFIGIRFPASVSPQRL